MLIKNTVILCLSLLVLCSILTVSVLAVDTTLTHEQAKELFAKAYSCYTIVQSGEEYVISDGQPDSLNMVVKETGELIDFQKSLSGEYYIDPYSNLMEEQSFFHVTITTQTGDVDTYEDMMQYIEEHFSDDMTKRISFKSGFPGWDVFRPDENGKLLMNYRCFALDGIKYFTFLGYGEGFSVNGSTATLDVVLGIFDGTIDIDEDNYIPYTRTVEFSQTGDGWVVSGGTFFETLQPKWEEVTVEMKNFYGGSNPSTGDNTLPTAALLATVALAAVITPFAISKKRRVR